MKKISYLILLCIGFINASAQIEISLLTYDPNRYSNHSNSEKSKNSRVSITNFKDTLELPFFEDFTQAAAPIDTVFTTQGEQLQIKVFGHHGLKKGDKIFIRCYPPNSVAFNGIYYAFPINKREFKISVLPNLDQLYIADGNPILGDFITWAKIGAKIGPNPDTLKWEDDGGVFISNQIAINPPSLYVATFDALNANGKPYLNSESSANTDFLTSQAINLLGMNADSKIVLSFYLQAGGLGGTPARADSIYLLFKDKNNLWKRVWGQKSTFSGFRKFSVPVKDEIFFHDGFQFKFQNFTLINGTVSSTYNLDYIYMDKDWSEEKEFPVDAAVNKSQSSILKRYSSIPNFQFNSSDLEDSVKFSLKNNNPQITSFGFTQNFKYSDGTISPLKEINVGFPEGGSTTISGWSVVPSLVTTSKDTTYINYEVDCKTGDKISTNRIRFNMNNKDSVSIKLANYYSYDDGSAEANLAIRNSSSGGRLMVKFELNNFPDTITHIDLFTPQSRYTSTTEPRYKSSRLIVADANNNLVESSTTDVALLFPQNRNGFVRYRLKKPFIATSKVFYVGYEQTHGLEVFYGLDRNYGPMSVQYYGFPQGPWQTLTISGALMIRPVLRLNDPAVSTESAFYSSLDCDLYPNPASDLLNIKGLVKNIEISDLSGKKIIQKTFSLSNNNEIIDISELQPGLYMVKLSNDNQQIVKKIIVSRD